MKYIKCFELFDFDKPSDKFEYTITEFNIDSQSYGCGVWEDDDGNTLSLQISYDKGTDSSKIKFKINNKTDKEDIPSYRKVNADTTYYLDILRKIKPYIEEYVRKVNPRFISIITTSPQKMNIYKYIISKLVSKLYRVQLIDITDKEIDRDKKYQLILTRLDPQFL